MDGDALKKVRPGDALDIPAGAYNAFVDAAEYIRRQSRTGAGSLGPERSPGVVLVKNTSGENVPRFGALVIDDILIAPDTATPATLDEFKNNFAFKGVKPATANLGKRFVIALEALPAGAEDDEENGKIGRAMIAGPVVCNVEYSSATGTPLTAGIKNGSFNLDANGRGAPVLYRKEGAGVQLAVVLLGAGGQAGEFDVDLSTPESGAGSNGTNTVPPDYAYKITLPGRTDPEDGTYPVRDRPFPSGMAYRGTHGTAYYDDDGLLVLKSANEVWYRGECVTP